MKKQGLDERWLKLLEDEQFAALLRKAHEDYMPWSEFLRLELPANMSPMGTWEVLTALLRAQALWFPQPTAGHEVYWCNVTNRISRCLSTIDRLCSSHSTLYRNVTTESGRPFMMKSRVADITASAEMDGLEISENSIRRLLELGHAPRSDAQRLVLNTMRVMTNIEEYADRPFEASLLNELHARLSEGVNTGCLPQTKPPVGLLIQTDLDRYLDTSPAQAIDFICAYANNEIGERYEHPAIRAVTFNEMIHHLHPLPDLNNQVGRLLSRLYCIKNGIPLLGLVPLTHAKVMWERGQPPYDQLSPSPREYAEWRGVDVCDATLNTTISLELAVMTLESLEQSMTRAAERDQRVRQTLAAGRHFNHRQRSIVARAMRDPDAEFRIGYHKMNHGITYATARKDLVRLVELGYLTCDRNGHAFVYRSGPEIRNLHESDVE